jgi:hypothetical protein
MGSDVIEMTPDEFERVRPLLYHTVTPEIAATMASIRRDNVLMALRILREQSRSRSQSLALTHLEEQQMRTLQGLAMGGEVQLPDGLVVTDRTGGTPGAV